jgi:hypothetical protein
VGAVAQTQFDLAEELSVGGIDEVFGHLAQQCFRGGPELVDEAANARFTFFPGR